MAILEFPSNQGPDLLEVEARLAQLREQVMGMAEWPASQEVITEIITPIKLELEAYQSRLAEKSGSNNGVEEDPFDKERRELYLKDIGRLLGWLSCK